MKHLIQKSSEYTSQEGRYCWNSSPGSCPNAFLMVGVLDVWERGHYYGTYFVSNSSNIAD